VAEVRRALELGDDSFDGARRATLMGTRTDDLRSDGGRQKARAAAARGQAATGPSPTAAMNGYDGSGIGGKRRTKP
jgi:hypothetical protein